MYTYLIIVVVAVMTIIIGLVLHYLDENCSRCCLPYEIESIIACVIAISIAAILASSVVVAAKNIPTPQAREEKANIELRIKAFDNLSPEEQTQTYVDAVTFNNKVSKDTRNRTNPWISWFIISDYIKAGYIDVSNFEVEKLPGDKVYE